MLADEPSRTRKPADDELRELHSALQALNRERAGAGLAKIAPLAALLEAVAAGESPSEQLPILIARALESAPAEKQDAWRFIFESPKGTGHRLSAEEAIPAIGNYETPDGRSAAAAYALAALLVPLAAEMVASDRPPKPPADRYRTTNIGQPRWSVFGRNEDLAAVAELMTKADCVVIAGHGGTGKTTLAVEYSRTANAEIVWVLDMTTPESAARGALELAIAAGLDGISTESSLAALPGILRGAGDWLLVADNLNDPTSLAKDLPIPEGGKVLITSRVHTGWPERTHTYHPRTLTPDSAADLVLSRARSTDRGAALDLARVVGYLPVALDHIGRVAEVDGISAVHARLRRYDAPPSAEVLPPAFIASVQEQMQRATEADDNAAVVAISLSLCEGGEIPRRVFAGGGSLPIDDSLSRDEVVSAVRTLAYYGLIRLTPEYADLHPVIADLIRGTLLTEAHIVASNFAIETLAVATCGVRGAPFDQYDLVVNDVCSFVNPVVRWVLIYYLTSPSRFDLIRLLNVLGILIRELITANRSFHAVDIAALVEQVDDRGAWREQRRSALMILLACRSLVLDGEGIRALCEELDLADDRLAKPLSVAGILASERQGQIYAAAVTNPPHPNAEEIRDVMRKRIQAWLVPRSVSFDETVDIETMLAHLTPEQHQSVRDLYQVWNERIRPVLDGASADLEEECGEISEELAAILDRIPSGACWMAMLIFNQIVDVCWVLFGNDALKEFEILLRLAGQVEAVIPSKHFQSAWLLLTMRKTYGPLALTVGKLQPESGP